MWRHIVWKYPLHFHTKSLFAIITVNKPTVHPNRPSIYTASRRFTLHQTVRYGHSYHLNKLKYSLTTQKADWSHKWRTKVPGLLPHRLYQLRVSINFHRPAGKCWAPALNCCIVPSWRSVGISLLLCSIANKQKVRNKAGVHFKFRSAKNGEMYLYWQSKGT